MLEIKNIIVAAVTINPNHVSGMPVFYAQDKKELESIASAVANIINGSVHQLANGMLIIVKR